MTDLTLAIAAGAQSASATFTLTPVDDALDEDDETISLDGSASGVTVTDASVAIIDDDATPTLSVADAGAVTEGNDPATTANMSFTVTLSAASGRDVTVPYTLGGTATAGSDYEEPQTKSITISAGDTSAAIVIKVKGDTADEDNETIKVTLGTLTNATVSSDQGAGTASGTITDDDATPTATLTLTPTSIKESSSTASETVSTVTASLSAATWEDVTVTVSVPNGSPVTVSTNKTLTIAKGATASTGTVTLTAVNDAVDTANREVAVSGTASGASVADPQAVTLTITDDDGRGVSVSKTSLTLAEADNTDTSDETENEATYTVKLDSEPTGDVTVTLASGDEKVAKVSPATLTFTAQSYAAQTVTVTAVADALANAGGKRTTTITHTVSAPGTDYAAVTAESVDIEVTDDDAASTGAVTLVANPDSLAESASATTVTVTATVPGSVARDTTTAITVAVGDSADAATEGTDYGTVEDFTLTVAAGSLTGTETFTLTPTQDTLDEGAGETLSVTGTTTVTGLTVGSDEITLTDDDAAPTGVTLTASPDSVTENGGAVTVTVTATVGGTTRFAAKQTVAVTVGKSGDSAASGTDYEAVTGFNIEIAPGADSGAKTFTLTPVDDALDENEETLSVEGALSGVTVTGDTIAITDDDGRGITVSETSLTLAEADNASTQGVTENEKTYTVGLDSEPTGTVTVTVASGDEKVAKVSPGTLTFTAQSYAAQTVTVTAVADALANAGGKRTTAITHTVSAPDTDYASVSAASVDIEVTDDETAPTGEIGLVANPDSLAESAEATTVTVTATVPGSVARDTDTVIAVVVGAGTDAATEGTDYATVDGFTLTVDAGSLTGTETFTLTPTQDTLDEGAGETLSVTGTTTVSGLTVGSDEITITDDDAAPELSVDAPSVTEGAGGSTATLSFTVTLSTASGQKVTVAYADPETGTATSGTDYQEISSGTLTFAAGETSKTVAVTVTGDNLDEGNETVVLRLSSASNATLSGGNATLDATGTITDDDDAPSGVTLTVDADTATDGVQSSVAEDGGAKTVRVTATVDGTTRFAAATTVTVVVGAAGDSATEGTDYSQVNDLTLTIAAGAQSASGTFTLTPTDDALDEADETISLDGSASGVTVTDASVAITDDDATPTVSVADAQAVTEGDDPATTANMSFTVTLSAASGRDVTVPYTLGGTATAGGDYEEPQTRSVTISAGDTSADIVIKVKGDTADEDNETVEVTLGTLTNATLSSDQGAGTASGTITDDDATPTATLTLTPSTIAESGAGNRATVTASLSAATWQDVTVTVSVANGSPVTASANKTLTIAKGATASTGTVTLTAVDNAVDASNASVTVSGAASGASVANPEAVTLTITDDDTRGVSVSVTQLTLPEADDTDSEDTEENEATYTVKLDSEPTGDVTVTLASGDEDVATVSPATLTFTAQSYAAKTVTVTAVADALANAGGKRSTTITHTVSADGTDYAAVTAESVTVEVTDDETALSGEIALVANPDSLAESAEATTVTVTATLPGSVARDTDTAITVAVGAGTDAAAEGTDYGTVDGFTLTVDAGSLTGTKTFSLDPTQDTLDEGTGETLSVTGTTTVTGLTVGSDEITITDDDAAPTGVTLTASPDSVTENGGARTVTVTATVSGTTRFAAKRTVAVTVGKSGDSAVSGTDYGQVTGFNVEIAPGADSGSADFTLTPVDDALDENEETLSVEGTLSGVTVTGDTIAIADDDGRGISVSVDKLTLPEADDASTTDATENAKTYTVKLDSEPTGDVTVTVASGDEKVAKVSPATLTFTAQSYAAQTVTVTAVADALANAGGKRTATITHTVSAPGTDYASVSAASVDIEVTDDEDAPSGEIGLVANPDSLAESASATTVTVTATVPGSVARDTDTVIAVTVGDSADAATEGTDYGTVDGFTLTVAAGSLTGTKTFSLDPTQDTLDEGTGETLSVTGTTTVTGLTVGSDEITITDDDAAPVLSVDAPSVTEGAGGSTATLTFTVTLSTASGQKVTVAYADRDTGTATSGTDYQALTAGTLTFAAGETSKTVAVTVTGDNLDEGNETVVLRLSSASNATLSGGNATLDATGTITDDDDAPSGVTLTVDADTATDGVQSSVAEDGGAKTVRVTATVDGTTRFVAATTVTVAVGAAGDSAVEGTDYSQVTDLTLAIAAGASSASDTFTLTPTDDALDEADETISLDGSASGVTVTDASVAIIDDDATPTVSVANAQAVTEGNDPATTANMSFTVTLSAVSGRDVTVPYTLGGTAAAGGDYEEPQTKSVTIDAGDTSAAIVIKVKGDTADEDNETIKVTLDTPTNATVSATQGAGTASGTITDDDATPTAELVLTPTSVKESSATASETVSTVTASLSAATWEDVTITVSVPNGSPVTVSTNKVLTIAAGATTSTGTVTLTAVNDAVDTANREVAVSGTASGAAVADPEAVTLTITDDDGRGITVSETSLTLPEADDTSTTGVTENAKTYTVALDSEPTGTVTVTVASGDSNVAKVSPATLTFTAQSYAAQTVTVTAVADALDNANDKRTTTITHTVAAPGTDYAAVTAASVDIDVTDDETAPTGEIDLVANPDTLAESASATTVTVTATVPGSVARDTTTAITVAVGDSADAATEGTDYGTVEDFTLTVAAGSLTGTETFTLTPTQDTLDEGAGETLSVTGTTTVTGLTVGSDEITITDDDAAAPDFSPEHGATVTDASTNITLTFAEAITKNSSAEALADGDLSALLTLAVDDENGTAIPFAASIDVAKKVITLNPSNDLADGKVYVAISDDYYDTTGNQGSMASATFTVDTTGPAAPRFSPAHDTTVKDASTDITLTFAEAITKNSSAEALADGDLSALLTLAVDDENGTAIPFAASIDVAKKVITLNPSNDLADGKVYVAISDDYYDTTGNQGSTASATFTVDTTAPTVSSAAVDGASLTITFNENLSAAANLANTAFEVKKTPDGGSEQTVTLSGSPSISGDTVTLTLAAAAAHDDTGVKVSYTKPASGSDNTLKDGAGNEVTSFTGQAVTNNTKSSDATLSGLAGSTSTDGSAFTGTLDIGTFAATTTAYTATVADNVTHVKLTPTVNQSDATVKVGKQGTTLASVTSGSASAAIALAAGANVIEVEVTAEDESTQKYTVTVRNKTKTYALSATASAAEGSNASLTVTLGENAPTGGLALTVTYNYSGSASSTDTGTTPSTVTVAENTKTATLTIPLASDDLVEGDEKFTATLSTAVAGWSAASSGASGTVTIEDDDNDNAKVAFGSSATGTAKHAVSVDEGVSGGALNVPVTVSAVPGSSTTFVIEVLNTGTATEYVSTQNPGDFRIETKSVTFGPTDTNSKTKNVAVTITNDSNLEPDETIQLKIAAASDPITAAEDRYARDANGALATVTITNDEHPPAPTVLVVTEGDTKLDLSWTAPTLPSGVSLTGYDVHYTSAPASGNGSVADDAAVQTGQSPSAASGWVDAAHSGTGTTDEITGLTNDTVYRLRVRATNAAGASAWLAGTGTPEEEDTTAPSVEFSPANGDTVTDADTNIVLTFSEAIRKDASDTELANTDLSSILTLKTNNVSGTAITFAASINDAKTKITINPSASLSDGAVHVAVSNEYYDEAGNQGSTASATFTVDTTGPAAPDFSPANAAKVTDAGTDITLTFAEAVKKDSDGGDFSGHSDLSAVLTLKKTDENGANIAYAASINPGKTVITLNPSSDLDGGAVYVAIGDGYYDAAGNQGSAATATFTVVPAAPTGLTVTAGNTQLGLTWTAPAGTVGSYDVHYTASSTVAADAAVQTGAQATAATGWLDASHTGTTASHAITGLDNNTEYRVRVRATNAAGASAWLAAKGTPVPAAPAAPADLEAESGDKSLSLTWTAPTGR